MAMDDGVARGDGVARVMGVARGVNVVLTRFRCSPPPCVYIRTHENDLMHVKNPVVHVRGRWIAETRKDPAGTLLTEG